MGQQVACQHQGVRAAMATLAGALGACWLWLGAPQLLFAQEHRNSLLAGGAVAG